MEEDEVYVIIRTSQKLMEMLGYPAEVECPFSEIFDQNQWCGWWSKDGTVLKIVITGDAFYSRTQIIFKDHTARDFYHSEILESEMCEDYGVEVEAEDGDIFIPHTQPLDYFVDPRYAIYCLKKYIPLVKRATA